MKPVVIPPDEDDDCGLAHRSQGGVDASLPWGGGASARETEGRQHYEQQLHSSSTRLLSYSMEDLLAEMDNADPSDAALLIRCCTQMWIWSWDDETAVLLGEQGAISLIVQAMANHPDNPQLQQSAVAALQNMVASHQHGCASPVAQYHAPQSAARAASVSCLFEYNRRELCEGGGLDLTLRAMQRYPGQASIQQAGCSILASLASASPGTLESSTAGPDYRQEIVQAGGLNAIVMAAHQFSSSGVQHAGVARAASDALQAFGYTLSCSAAPSVSASSRRGSA